MQRLPSIISARKEFSTASQKNASPKPGPTGKPPESKRNILQVVVGVVVVAGAGLFAYQNGHLDQYFCKKKEKLDYLDSFKFSEDKNSVKDDYHVVEPMVTSHSDEEPNTSSHVVEQATQSVETDKDLPQYEDSSKIPVEDQSHLQDKAELTTEDSTIVVKDKDMAKNSNESIASHKQSTSPPVSSKGSAEMEKSESKTSKESDEKVQGTEILSSASVVPKEDEQKTLPQQSIITEEKSEEKFEKELRDSRAR